jgi:glycosyltransferase involved in cell wall biosynthesis
VLLRLIDECRRRFVRFAYAEQFDLIHAHDWVTFPAAAAVAKTKGTPWIAHFHSIEGDRRPDQPDRAIQRIEREGAQAASAVLVPSKVSAQSLFAAYQIPVDTIEIAPNTLSREAIAPAEYGLPDMRRVLFLGRLTPQKGPDLFAKIAVELRSRMSDVTFDVRGSGEQIDELQRAGICPSGEVEWSVRGRAFGESSALLVTSRAEPFGMVILEAMQRRVPVFYPRYAGAAEVLQSGIKIDPTDTLAVATALADMLNNRDRWEEVVMQQSREIAAYLERGYERVVQTMYQRLTQASSETRAASS